MALKIVLCGILVLFFASEAFAMQCEIVRGISLSCPGTSNDPRAFCCTGPLDVPYCCEANEYLKQNPGIVAGIIIGVLILLVLPICCCICCFCACCPIAKRRKGVVIYRY